MKDVAFRFLCSLCLVWSFFSPLGSAQDKSPQDQKQPLGMSILGNQEAPKALVIVPWRRSELGDIQGISTVLDDSKKPIDKEVFMRVLSYYEIRSETARPAGTPAKTNAALPNAAAQRPDANKRRKQ